MIAILSAEPEAPQCAQAIEKAEHRRVARAAYRDFGKGAGHPAGLNFGDCFAYAPASELGEPLLFKGNDFVHTDLTAALDT